jgi:[ribosomal protein S18]-alanine N-acetyltransferase
MTIRTAVAADTAALDTLERSLFTHENYPLSRRAFYYHIRNSLLLVAHTEEGELAGYILILVKRSKPKLYSLGIALEFRNRGIASMLLQTVLQTLMARGFKHMVLEVRKDNETAIALYRRFGFNTVKTLKGFYKDGCDAFYMELSEMK